MKVENDKQLQSSKSGNKRHHHAGHSWIMALCIGIPVIAVLGAWLFGVGVAMADLLLFLLCPIVMGVMMWAMERGHGRTESASTRVTRGSQSVEKQSAAKPGLSEGFSTWEA